MFFKGRRLGIINSMANQIISQVILYLADFSKFIQKYIGNVSLPKPHYSWLVILFFVFVVFMAALILGRSRMLLALVGLYIAAFLEPIFFSLAVIRNLTKGRPDYLVHLVLFLVIYIVVFLILNRSILKQRLTMKESSLFTAGAIAILEIGFLASIILQYLPPTAIKGLSPKIIGYFATKNARFWWAVTPLIALIFLKRKKEVPGI